MAFVQQSLGLSPTPLVRILGYKVNYFYIRKVLIASCSQSLANRIWTVNSDATYQPEEARTGNHRRGLHYKLIPGKERDFWRYRTRLKAALKASGWPSRVGVMNCQSGCNGRWVQIRYHHESFAGEAKDNQEMFPVVVAKYNEMYGEEAYKDDSDRLAQSVSDSWTQHQKLRPEMSSNW